tara:strand:- start:54 stop:413 length:360 start_codon:yes stop_codon:yes gene_type:complete
MDTVNLTFPSPINISCKVGDVAYYVNTATIVGFTVSNDPWLIGTINSIITTGNNTILNVNLEGEFASGVTSSDFILFSKNNLVEISSIKGYYAQAQFRNDSTTAAEFFETACEIEESSK